MLVQGPITDSAKVSEIGDQLGRVNGAKGQDEIDE